MISFLNRIKYNIGETVYLKTDPEQQEYLVIGIDIRPEGIMYLLSFCATDSFHYAIEISKEKNISKKMNI